MSDGKHERNIGHYIYKEEAISVEILVLPVDDHKSPIFRPHIVGAGGKHVHTGQISSL